MNQYLNYILETSICLILFYLVYVLFRRDTFYQLKRIYLVTTVIISFIIPQIPSSTLPAEVNQIDFKPVKIELNNVDFQNKPITPVPALTPDIGTSDSFTLSFSIFEAILLIYMLGSIYFLFRLIKNLWHIRHVYRDHQKDIVNGYKLVILSNGYPTFSFLNCIFLNPKNLSNEEKANVISHELVHIKQKHSIDILFFEICKVALWFNPIIWLCKSSIIKVHECLADQGIIEKEPEKIIDYQSLLLKQYLNKLNIEPAHNFNYSLVKYRIVMMTKNRSKWWAKYKLILVIPVIVVGLLAFSNSETINEKFEINETLKNDKLLHNNDSTKYSTELNGKRKEKATSKVSANKTEKMLNKNKPKYKQYEIDETLKNGKHFIVEKTTLYSAEFIKKLREWASSDDSNLKDTVSLIGDSMVVYFPDKIPVCLPMNQTISYKAESKNFTYMLSLKQINLTNIIYVLVVNDKIVTNGQAVLDPGFTLGYEAGPGYYMQQYFDFNDRWTSLKVEYGTPNRVDFYMESDKDPNLNYKDVPQLVYKSTIDPKYLNIATKELLSSQLSHYLSQLTEDSTFQIDYNSIESENAITTQYPETKSDLKKEYIDYITNFISLVRNDDKQGIANLMHFPYRRSYPIPDIQSKQEFTNRYEEIFDNNLKQIIISSNPTKDWAEVGWRGIMLNNGTLWLNTDGSLGNTNYQTKVEKELLIKMIDEDRHNIHPSLTNYIRPYYILETAKYIVRIDLMENNKFRYASWSNTRLMKEKPDLVINNGEIKYNGNGGNHFFEFKNGNYLYECFINVLGNDHTPPAVLKVLKDNEEILNENAMIVRD